MVLSLMALQTYRNNWVTKCIKNTVKPLYNELGYNEFPVITEHIVLTDRIEKSIGYNENSLLTNAFGRTDLSVINGFNCTICLI
jgi:hypothetical protein